MGNTGATHVPNHPRTITAYDVTNDGRELRNPRTLCICNAGFFDGFRVDVWGNVWTSTAEGVHCYTPDGGHIGTVRMPELVSNVCFGGPKRNRLFIKARTSLYAIFLNTHG